MTKMLTLRNGSAAPLDRLPVVALRAFQETVLDAVAKGGRIVALFGRPIEDDAVRLTAVVREARSDQLGAMAADVEESYPSLAPHCPQAALFEREIAEQWGVRPEGHPWLKPVRFHRAWRAGRDAWDRPEKDEILPCVGDFYRMAGDEVHEVSVGPVHAGIIEPGHFRFQCHGEDVFHLEISLGYQHRGVERALIDGPGARTAAFMETLAGDTTIGHATAWSMAMEALSGTRPSARAEALRGIALELERLANHIGDLGALANDVGYLPTASYCGRLRGDALNMTALLCGNRFGRGLVRPGGVCFDLESSRAAELLDRLQRTFRDTENAANLLWHTPSVTARFEETGTVSRETCIALGLVGPAARACGVAYDVRADLPTGVYAVAPMPVSTWPTGDVFARAMVRWLEIQRSTDYIRERVNALPEGELRADAAPLAAESIAVALVEGWRGEIAHVVLTDARGRFASYKVVDPSFHNWLGLALALRGQPISDFPLCNKSFNLSYCGHDL